jgi:hypothetical protein
MQGKMDLSANQAPLQGSASQTTLQGSTQQTTLQGGVEKNVENPQPMEEEFPKEDNKPNSPSDTCPKKGKVEDNETPLPPFLSGEGIPDPNVPGGSGGKPPYKGQVEDGGTPKTPPLVSQQPKLAPDDNQPKPQPTPTLTGDIQKTCQEQAADSHAAVMTGGPVEGVA